MLFDSIKLNYPNIWIKDSDSSRIVEVITSTIDRDYYVIDFLSGFSKYCEGEWKSVLVPNPLAEMTGGPELIVTYDPSISMTYLLENAPTFTKPATYFINVQLSQCLRTLLTLNHPIVKLFGMMIFH